jgi:serine/threonine protein kinase
MSQRFLSSRYRLAGEIGRGGMSVVFEATDERLGRKVAVKLLELDETGNPGATDRFRREALIAASLNHPNIVSIFDTGVDGSTAFIVMELLSGPTLAAKLAESGPLSVGEILTVCAQVCAALSAAHAAGVVHRDIKPSNISYASTGSVKVLDFGVARLIESATGESALTRTAMIIGTAAFLSPEQALGGPIGPSTDLYALGCVLFALATGRPPFLGESAVAVCSQHLHAEPPSLLALAPAIPPELASLVADLLRKDPVERPLNAEAVRIRIVALQAGGGLMGSTLPLGPAFEVPTAVWPKSSSTEVLPGSLQVSDPPLNTPEPIPSTPDGERTEHAKRWLWLGAGVLLLAAIGAVLSLALSKSPGHSPTTTVPTSQAHTTTSSTTTSTPSTTSSTTTTSTTTTTTLPRPSTALQAIQDLQSAVDQARSAKELTPSAAQELTSRLKTLSTAVSNNNDKAAGRDMAGLLRQMANLSRSGELTPAGQARLAPPLAALETFIQPQPGKPGKPGKGP